MRGFKSFWSAAVTLAGIELMHMIRNGQLTAAGRLRPANQLYSTEPFWVLDEGIQRRSKRNRVPYDVWRDQGFLSATPGNATDFAFIKREILDLTGRFDIQEIGYDRTFAGEIVANLQGNNLQLVKFRQGSLSLAAPTVELERLVISRSLWHAGHPVLRWNASNMGGAGPSWQHQAGQGAFTQAHRWHFSAGQCLRTSVASRCDRWSISLRDARVVSFLNSATDVHSRRLKHGGPFESSPECIQRHGATGRGRQHQTRQGAIALTGYVRWSTHLDVHGCNTAAGSALVVES